MSTAFDKAGPTKSSSMSSTTGAMICPIERDAERTGAALPTERLIHLGTRSWNHVPYTFAFCRGGDGGKRGTLQDLKPTTMRKQCKFRTLAVDGKRDKLSTWGPTDRAIAPVLLRQVALFSILLPMFRMPLVRGL